MSEISLDKAEAYLKAKEYIKALSVLKIILKDEPDQIDAIRMSVKIYTKLAKYEKAIKILQNVLELHPDYTWVLFSLGSLYKIIGEYDKAIKIYTNLLKTYQEDTKIPLRLAELYNKSKNYDKAIECLEKYIDYDPSDSIAWFELGFSYKKKGDPARFRDAFSKATSIEHTVFDKKKQVVELSSISAFPKKKKNYPQGCTACCSVFCGIITIGMLLIPGGLFIPGVGIFFIPFMIIFIVLLIALWSVKGEGKNVEPKVLFESEKSYKLPIKNIEIIGTWQKLFNFYWISKRYEKLIQICGYALVIFPKRANIYLILGRAYININFYSRAIEVFKKGLEIDSENISLLSSLRGAYISNKEYAKAESTLESSLRIDSDNLDLLISYSEILYKNRKYEDSSKNFIKALNTVNQNIKRMILELPKIKFPIDENTVRKFYFEYSEDLDKKYDQFTDNIRYKIQISFELGLAFMNIGEFDKVEVLAKESLSVMENDSAYNLLMFFNFYLENYQESINACIKSLEIDEKQKVIRAMLIHLYFKSGNAEKALEIAKLMLQDEPEDELIWSKLGYIYSKTGEYEKATEVLNRAIQINYKLAQPWNHLGYIEYKNGNIEQALKYIKKAIKRNPDYVRAFYYMADVLFSQEKPDEALVYCNECLKINPNFKDAYILRDKIKS